MDPDQPGDTDCPRPELSEHQQSKRTERLVNVLVLVINILVLLVGIPAAIVAVWDIRNRLKDIKLENIKIEESQRAVRMQIFQPRNNDIVGINVVVSGYTAFSDRNNYLIVTDGRAGINYIQNGKIRVEPAGNWSHTAVLGDANSCGVEFLITEIATNQVITTSIVEPFPADAIMAPTIRVQRERCKQ